MQESTLETLGIPGCKDSGLHEYLTWATNRPHMGQEEASALAQKIAAGDRDALAQLVIGNTRLVLAVAKLYQGRGPTFDALVDEGNKGLLEAAQRYVQEGDFSKTFVSYASWVIRASLEQTVLESLQQWQAEHQASIDVIGPIDDEAVLIKRVAEEEEDQSALIAISLHFKPYIPLVLDAIQKQNADNLLPDGFEELAQKTLPLAIKAYRYNAYERQGWDYPLSVHLYLSLYRILNNALLKLSDTDESPTKDPKESKRDN